MVTEIRSEERVELERRYRVTGERLDMAERLLERAENAQRQIQTASNVLNDRMVANRRTIEVESAALDSSIIETGTIDAKAIQKLGQLSHELKILGDVYDRVVLQHTANANVQRAEASAGVNSALAARYTAKANIQEHDRNELLKTVSALEGEVQVAANIGLSAELRRTAAKYLSAADIDKKEADSLRQKLNERI